MQKRFIPTLIVLLSMLVAGCVAQPTGGSANATPNLARVVYVINGALGDNAFYDSGQAGIDQIKQEYGLETRTIETNFDAGHYEPALQAAVTYADVIFVISYGFEDQLKEYADKYPNKIFVNVDTVVENSQDTITSVDLLKKRARI